MVSNISYVKTVQGKKTVLYSNVLDLNKRGKELRILVKLSMKWRVLHNTISSTNIIKLFIIKITINKGWAIPFVIFNTKMQRIR